MEGAKFLVVQPLDKNYKEEGIPIISLDFTQAGLGDLVYLVKGREASIPWEIKNAPIDASIVGIIDKVGR
ncbi:MAG: ethanolamine utilization protein EutN [Armatimonadetes bacterium]|nr:ethanolamine utilization protein EutN [Armatimonadota bacterium]